MSAHLLRFLMTFAGMLSLRANTTHSMVSAQWLTDVMIACLRARPASDTELDAMSPLVRVAWMIDHYRAVLHKMAPSAVAEAGARRDVTFSMIENTLAEVRQRLPQLQGDLSIDAVNEAIGLSPQSD